MIPFREVRLNGSAYWFIADAKPVPALPEFTKSLDKLRLDITSTDVYAGHYEHKDGVYKSWIPALLECYYNYLLLKSHGIMWDPDNKIRESTDEFDHNFLTISFGGRAYGETFDFLQFENAASALSHHFYSIGDGVEYKKDVLANMAATHKLCLAFERELFVLLYTVGLDTTRLLAKLNAMVRRDARAYKLEIPNI